MLHTDYDLSREDIQLLSSRDALAAFFAKLGYDTNVRLIQNVHAMGITNDTLRASIKHIERLANREVLGLLFEVYLFELRSVTVAATQAIARSFRDRPGDYLLVLTSDYQELDFVLVQRYIPTRQQETSASGILPEYGQKGLTSTTIPTLKDTCFLSKTPSRPVTTSKVGKLIGGKLAIHETLSYFLVICREFLYLLLLLATNSVLTIGSD